MNLVSLVSLIKLLKLLKFSNLSNLSNNKSCHSLPFNAIVFFPDSPVTPSQIVKIWSEVYCICEN